MPDASRQIYLSSVGAQVEAHRQGVPGRPERPASARAPPSRPDHLDPPGFQQALSDGRSSAHSQPWGLEALAQLSGGPCRAGRGDPNQAQAAAHQKARTPPGMGAWPAQGPTTGARKREEENSHFKRLRKPVCFFFQPFVRCRSIGRCHCSSPMLQTQAWFTPSRQLAQAEGRVLPAQGRQFVRTPGLVAAPPAIGSRAPLQPETASPGSAPVDASARGQDGPALLRACSRTPRLLPVAPPDRRKPSALSGRATKRNHQAAAAFLHLRPPGEHLPRGPPSSPKLSGQSQNPRRLASSICGPCCQQHRLQPGAHRSFDGASAQRSGFCANQRRSRFGRSPAAGGQADAPRQAGTIAARRPKRSAQRPIRGQTRWAWSTRQAANPRHLPKDAMTAGQLPAPQELGKGSRPWAVVTETIGLAQRRTDQPNQRRNAGKPAADPHHIDKRHPTAPTSWK